MDNKSAIEKAVATIGSIKAELDDLPKYDLIKLNDVENRIRVELQVMEALVNHVGRETYTRIQDRRHQLRKENQQWVKTVVEPSQKKGKK